MSLLPELAGAIPVLEMFQVEEFVRSMQKQMQSGGPQDKEKFTLKDMLCFQKVILKYMGVNAATPVSIPNQIELVTKLYEQTLKCAQLRDELFVQISKQTRNNPDRLYLLKAWELMFLCISAMPPGKDIVAYLSEYVHDVATAVSTDLEVQALAMNTWNALKRSVKAGRRRSIPAPEEIEALLSHRKHTTIVYFLDGKFEELHYNMSTTVADAVEELAGIIKLSAYNTFSLFECRTILTGSKSLDHRNEEYVLDDNKYIGDLLAKFKAAKDGSKGEIVHCKFSFKKRLFLASDEVITEPMFVQLYYVQLQHDYILGNYPVGREDAAQLAALQIHAEIGFVSNQESSIKWTALLEKYIPKEIAVTRAKRDWETDILICYRSMEHLSMDKSRQQFLCILRSLPYGNSVFFSVSKIEDPIGLLPERIILGINKHGVHFFRPVPKKFLHSAELCDIMQFGNSSTRVVFKMVVAGLLHLFQFETKQGGEIVVALQTHIESAPQAQTSERKFDRECDTLRARVGDLEKALLEKTRASSVAESTLALRSSELDALQGSLKELEDLRKMKEDIHVEQVKKTRRKTSKPYSRSIVATTVKMEEN